MIPSTINPAFIPTFGGIAAIVGSILASYKIINVFVTSKKLYRREEFKFIKEFMSDLRPDTHPLIIEKGYLAIMGNSTLTANEITYLLSFSSPSQALEKYSAARKYIEIKETAEAKRAKVVFQDGYTKNKRTWLKNINRILYFIFATFALIPIPFAKNILSTHWQIGLIVISMIFLSFGFLALTSLVEYGRILRGEELIAMQ